MKHVLAVLAAGGLSIGAVPMAGAQMRHGDMKGMDHTQPAKSQIHKGTGVVTNVERNAAQMFARITCKPLAGVANRTQLLIVVGRPEVPRRPVEEQKSPRPRRGRKG